MHYLVISKNPTTGYLDFDILRYRKDVAPYIESCCSSIIKNCNYDPETIKKYILVVEIDPTYEFLSLDITRPAEFSIKLKGN